MHEDLASPGYLGFIIIQIIILPNFTSLRNFIMRVDFDPLDLLNYFFLHSSINFFFLFILPQTISIAQV